MDYAFRRVFSGPVGPVEFWKTN